MWAVKVGKTMDKKALIFLKIFGQCIVFSLTDPIYS